jgi:predicted CopG family antitoxin
MRKTLTVQETTWKKLNKLKYKFDCETIDEVIDRLLLILTKFKLAKEFEDLA